MIWIDHGAFPAMEILYTFVVASHLFLHSGSGGIPTSCACGAVLDMGNFQFEIV